MPIPIQQPQPHRAQPQAAAAAAGPIGAAGAQVHPWQALFAHRNRLLAQQQQRQQQQQLEEEEEERFEYKVPDCIPISPEAFLKFFSL